MLSFNNSVSKYHRLLHILFVSINVGNTTTFLFLVFKHHNYLFCYVKRSTNNIKTNFMTSLPD